MTEAVVAAAEQSAPSVSEEVKQTEAITPETAAGVGVEAKQEEPPKTFTQAEVDAMVQKRLAKERRNEARRIEAQLREAQQASRLKAPERERFQDEETFTQAQVEHLAAKRAEQLLAERREAEDRERRATTFQEKADKASERFPDFDEVVGRPDLHINDAMAEFITESELGPDLAYHLGKNPAKASQIARMSPVQAARELTRIEQQLGESAKPHQSSAPKPLTPTRGAASPEGLHPGLSDEEWIRRREKELRDRKN